MASNSASSLSKASSSASPISESFFLGVTTFLGVVALGVTVRGDFERSVRGSDRAFKLAVVVNGAIELVVPTLLGTGTGEVRTRFLLEEEKVRSDLEV